MFQDLLTFPLDALHELWNKVQGHSEIRQGWITELDDRLKKAEDDRMDMVNSSILIDSGVVFSCSTRMDPSSKTN